MNTLSAQNITPPKGGGDRTITARALHDGDRRRVTPLPATNTTWRLYDYTTGLSKE